MIKFKVSWAAGHGSVYAGHGEREGRLEGGVGCKGGLWAGVQEAGLRLRWRLGTMVCGGRRGGMGKGDLLPWSRAQV